MRGDQAPGAMRHVFRELLLELEGVAEGAHMGHPDFRLGGRVFASLTADGARGTVRLSPDEQAALMADAPEIFAPAPGAWGRQGWTTVALAHAGTTHLRSACVLAWQRASAVAPRPRARR